MNGIGPLHSANSTFYQFAQFSDNRALYTDHALPAPQKNENLFFF